MSLNDVKKKQTQIDHMPDEVILKMFSYFNAQDLCHCACVSSRWNLLAMDGSLWKELRPVQWAKGDIISANTSYECYHVCFQI